MPVANSDFNVDCLVSVSNRFVNGVSRRNNLKARHDWSTQGLSSRNRTTKHSDVDNAVLCDVFLEEVYAIILKAQARVLKAFEKFKPKNFELTKTGERSDGPESAEDIMNDATVAAEDLDLTHAEGWTRRLHRQQN